MRSPRTPLVALMIALAALTGFVTPNALAAAPHGSPRAGERTGPRTVPEDPDEPPREARQAECRTRIKGSTVFTVCHNPYAETDRVQLHIECDRWWDPDVDGKRVEVGPARTVELSDRCWKGIRAVWVTHQRY
ncbi:hypothetical protein [Streptomyces sp. H27-D2]|uniref:hypothetical protein n=1 Tax=Streptomyces sp. H27-D2 TaxID=3046304 RepID=UPI002DBB5014|nr:hypothetical protein [Streptomyces sp. H27-D2]MEC4017750.1 hypothetical protein [Streptomyces sp. H27-D2]